MSGRFSPLTAPLPFRDLPLRAPPVFPTPALFRSSEFLALSAPFSASLRLQRSNALLLCSHVTCQYVTRVTCYPHKYCFTWYYYIDSCNARYAPNRRIWHLKFQKFSGGNTPGPPRREGATPSRKGGDPVPHLPPARPLAVRGGASAPGVGTRASKSVPPNPKLPLHPWLGQS